MAKLTNSQQNYLNALESYQELYVKFSRGNHTGSYAKYEQLKHNVVSAAQYLRMLESNNPSLVALKPKKFTARY